MSFLFKKIGVNFADLTLQAVPPSLEPTEKIVTPLSSPILKGIEKDLVSIAAELKKNSDAIAVGDKTIEYNLHEIQSRFAARIASNFDVSSLAHSFPKFKPYENLTGLTTTRPEVIMMTTFKPLFEDEKRADALSRETNMSHNFTNEGELIDAQIQLFNLKFEAFSKLISDMKQNPDANKLLVDNETQFLAHIDKMVSNSNFLRSIVLTIENLKQFINLRGNRNTIDFSKIVYNYFKTTSAGLAGEIVSSFAASTDYFKILQDCGFTENNTKNFSNTKLYLQSLYELKKLLVGASDKITGIDTSQKSKDTNSTTMIKSKIVDANQDLSAITNVSSSELKNMRGANIKGIAAKVTSAFNFMDSIQAASTDDRIALLYHAVSKEYSYSYALSDQAFIKFLEQTYGYRVSQTGNSQMFDATIGHPGNRIIDRVYSLNPNAAMSVAQQEKTDYVVLPFESDYIDYDSSVFSPGSVYYIDEAIKVSGAGVNVTNPNELRLIAENQTKHLSTLYKFLIPRLQNTFNKDTAYGEKISNSKKFFESCMDTFLDPSTKTLKPVFENSNLGIVFDKARTDPYLKSLLFMYFHVRTLGIDNDDAFYLSSKGVIEDLSAEIGKRLLQGTTGPSRLSMIALLNSSNTVSSTVAASIETELKNKSEFTNLFAAQLTAIYNTFTFSNCFNTNQTTKYSGMASAVLFLTIFEMLFATFASLNSKKATSFTSNVISPTVAVNSRSSNAFLLNSLNSYSFARASFSERISSKLKFENDLILKILFVHLNTFDSIQNAFRNAISMLQRNDTVKSLNDILKIVETNEELSLLINEPQINIVNNAIDDIKSRFDQRVRSNYERDTNRLDVAASYLKTTKNDLVLFDDFLLSSDVKKILYEFFSDQKYLVNRAFNSRIISVGIPQGFHRFLREKVSLSNVSQRTIAEKESDIIKMNVYKVDVRYQNLVFKPQTFLFELSRFVSKDYSSYSAVKEGASERDISFGIPMRDYSIITDKSTESTALEFGRPDIPLYTSPEYDFLSVEEKDQLVVNHVRSHMLELYMKLLTGFSVNEIDFPVNDDSISISSMSPIIVNRLIDETLINSSDNPKPLGNIKNVITANRSVNISAQIAATTTVPNKSTFAVEIKNNPRITAFFRTQNKVIIDAKKNRTLYSDIGIEAKKILKPKMFDRVFNVFVDPDDFEIDQQETIRTDSGKDMLESLFSSGKVVEIVGQSTQRSTQVNFSSQLKIIDKNPQENDAIFEKYFVTLETVLGDVV